MIDTDLDMTRENGDQFEIERARHVDVEMVSGNHWHVVWSRGWGWVLLFALLLVAYIGFMLGAALDQHGYIPPIRR